jgi:hypothetical protein
MKHSLVIACLFSIAITLNGQNSFPLTSSGDYTGGSGDHTNITNAQLKLQSTVGYIRVAHLSVATSISTVYNYQANKNVYRGEDSDGGQYLFRGRDVNIGRNLWVNNGATVSSDFADNDPNYSWNSNLSVRNNNGAINTFSRLSFVSQSGGMGAISLKKTDTYSGDMYFQVRNGAGFFSTPLLIKSNGNVGIGTTNPGSFKLAVEGKIGAREVQVTLQNPWPDYVFEPTYDLKPLAEIETYIKENKHLPEVPSAKEMEKKGVNLGEMNMLLLRKIEELTLYILDQNKEIEKLKEHTVSPDASGKKVEELTLYVIELKKRDEAQQKEIEELKKNKE